MTNAFDLLQIINAVVGGLLLMICFVAVVIIRLAGGTMTIHQRLIFGTMAALGSSMVLLLIPASGWTAVFRTSRQGDIRLCVGAWALAEWETDTGPLQRVLASEVSLVPATNEEIIGAAFLRYEVVQSDD